MTDPFFLLLDVDVVEEKLQTSVAAPPGASLWRMRHFRSLLLRRVCGYRQRVAPKHIYLAKCLLVVNLCFGVDLLENARGRTSFIGFACGL